MMLRSKFLTISPNQVWIGFLLALILAGIAGGISVFINGLVITNLTDQIPWGLWITIDLSSIALSAGAFTFCAAVYLFGLKPLKPLARTAAFTGLIGYSMAMLCLLLDIGRPERFYFGFIYWNTHSVLWEVTMCVGLYFAVLTMENLPNISRWKWLQVNTPKLARRMSTTHDYAPFLAMAGLILSFLHQSSLGAMYGVLISRPIWYRPGVAGLFFVSAIAGGVALTMIVAVVSGLIDARQQLEDSVTNQIARILGWILLTYLYLKFWDLFAMTYTSQPGRAEGLELLTQGALASNLWFWEISIGIILPIILLWTPRYRQSKFVLLASLIMVVCGVVAFRWDITMVGQMIVQSPLSVGIPPSYASYNPSPVEIVTSAGIVSYGLLAISFGIRKLSLLTKEAW